MEAKDIKNIVREKYSRIAQKSDDPLIRENCCGSTDCCSGSDYTVFSESYKNLEGYNPDADLGLGCGIPTDYAVIKAGNHVLDLGSGAGNDCFVVRSLVGVTGRVTGLDFSDDMLKKSNENVKKLGYINVGFVKGDIEQMPFPDGQFDVIVSNCVLNLVPGKVKAFTEMFRVLKPGGHFCISDVVVEGEMSEKLRVNAEMYAGCVSGAMKYNDYLDVISQTGFKQVQVHKKRELAIPDHIPGENIDAAETEPFKTGITGLYSITLSAVKL
ncbi:MAG: arsenite methyltransferase [Bacteroidales bacterium]